MVHFTPQSSVEPRTLGKIPYGAATSSQSTCTGNGFTAVLPSAEQQDIAG